MENDILTVFLVEDSTPVRRKIAMLLQRIAGVTVIGEAEDGDTALRAIFACRPDIAVIDLRLSAGNGIDLLSALSQAMPEVVTIALTNNSGPAFRTASTTAGAHYFFDKTTEFHTACRTVENLASMRRRVERR